jgi:hypothetical protein
MYLACTQYFLNETLDGFQNESLPMFDTMVVIMVKSGCSDEAEGKEMKTKQN